MSIQTIVEMKLLIVFITAYTCQIISSYIKEHTLQQAGSTVGRKRLAWTNLLI